MNWYPSSPGVWESERALVICVVFGWSAFWWPTAWKRVYLGWSWTRAGAQRKVEDAVAQAAK